MPNSWNRKVSKSEFTRINRELKRYFRRTMPHASAEDLAADTWVRIIRSYEGRCSLRWFAFSVARWTGLDARRKHEREIVTTPLGDVEPTANGPGPHSVLMLVTDHAMIERARASSGTRGRNLQGRAPPVARGPRQCPDRR
jgi:DNA-directed RNA polymerase specialized sigma24 family protein